MKVRKDKVRIWMITAYFVKKIAENNPDKCWYRIDCNKVKKKIMKYYAFWKYGVAPFMLGGEVDKFCRMEE